MKIRDVLTLRLISPIFLLSSAFEINKEEYLLLDKLALAFDPNKESGKSTNGHNYTEVYSYYFGPIRDKPLKILEIGILTGAGAQLWENYFPNAELHYIDLNFEQVKYPLKKSHFHIADQGNPAQLQHVMQTIENQFDIIIDDGGHTMHQQIVSFKILFPFLKNGGLYIIEDLHTSYWKDYGGGGTRSRPYAGPGTTVQFLKDLIDDVNFVGARTESASHKQDLSSIKQELNSYREQIFSMHFYDSLCIIIKR
jgi:hypothetical protein